MKSQGFTLVEMLVTVLIFSVIVGACIGVFVSAIRTQKYTLTYQQLLGQTSYAMEYMARAIRMARINDDGICIGMALNANYEETYGGQGVRFATYHSQCWEFFLGDGQLKVDKDGTEYELTSGDFEVTTLNFELYGQSRDNTFQPRVTVFMEIKGEGSGYQPKIRIQTTISQRNLDTN